MRRGYTELAAIEAGASAGNRLRRFTPFLTGSAIETGGHRFGHLLAVYDRSVYIEWFDQPTWNASERPLIALGRSDLAPGPLLLRLETPTGFSFRRLGLEKGARCRVRPTDTGLHLTVGHVLTVPVESAVLKPNRRTTRRRWTLDDLRRNSQTWDRGAGLHSTLVDRGVQDGLGWMEHLSRSPPEPLEELSRDLASTLVGQGHDAGTVPATLEALIGRGPGTTPAGDDVLCGLMLAIHRAEDPAIRSRNTELGHTITGRATDLTTKISLAHLEQAARGRAPEAVDRLLDTLLGHTTNRPTVIRAAESVVDYGHTSGADLLVGILTAILHVGPAMHRVTRSGHLQA